MGRLRARRLPPPTDRAPDPRHTYTDPENSHASAALPHPAGHRPGGLPAGRRRPVRHRHSGHLITGRQIKDGTVASRDVTNGGVTGADVRDGTLGAADVDGSLAGPVGPRSGRCDRSDGSARPARPDWAHRGDRPGRPAGRDGAGRGKGPAGIRGWQTAVSAAKRIAPDQVLRFDVACGQDRYVLSGGLSTASDPQKVDLLMSAPRPDMRAWMFTVRNVGTSDLYEEGWVTCAHAS